MNFIMTIAVAALFGGCESTPEGPKELPVEPKIEITQDRVTETSLTVTFKPNNGVASWAYALGSEGDGAKFEAGTIAGHTEVKTGGNKSVSFNDLTPGTAYTVFAQPVSKSGTKGKVVTLVCRTTALPEPKIEITRDRATENSFTVTFKPNSVVASWAYAIGTESDGPAFEAGTIAGYTEVTTSGNKTVVFDELASGTAYTVFAQPVSKSGTKGKVFTLVCRTTSPGNESSLRCVGYLTTWDYTHILNNLDWTALTHVNIAFCNPDSSGNLTITDWNDATLKSVVEKAHTNGVKVLPSVRSGEASLFATAQARTSFVNKILAYVEKFGFDGFDIDLEKSDAGFWTNYEKFVVELDQKFDEKGLLLTTAVSTWFSDNITDRTFACFDFINTMSYDLGFANHSTYNDTKNMVEHYKNKRNIPANKIVIGVPFYGYLKTTNSWNDFMYYKQLVALSGAAADVDEYNNHVYNGRPTMKRKSELASEYGGVMIWTVNYDTTDQYSLLKVIKENLFQEGLAPRPVVN